MAFYGYCVLVLAGMICQTDIHRHIRHAIMVDFSYGFVLEYLDKYLALANDLHDRDGIDLSECYIDGGTFIVAKKERGGNEIGRATKQRGKDTKKLTTISDNADGLPISIYITSTASPHHEVTTLEEATISTKCYL
jgi:hypothetical protein